MAVDIPDVVTDAPAVDLTTAGAEVTDEQRATLAAQFGGMSSATVSPYFHKNWTNEEIGWNFHSLTRRVEEMEKDRNVNGKR